MSGNEDTTQTPPDGPLSVDDVRDDLNAIESALAGASATDEYLAAILRAQRTSLEIAQQQGAAAGVVDDDGTPRGGRFSSPEQGALPEDAIGTVARDIQPNATGPAVFDINGTLFYAVVKNDDDDPLQAGQSIRVIGGRNRVTARDASGGFGTVADASQEGIFRFKGNIFNIPEVISRDQDVKVANQKYERGTYTSVSGDLAPGEDKEMARIEVDNDQLLLFKYTNATAHSTVEYEYYIDNTNEADKDLSGSTPWATPPSLFEVVPDGWNIVEDFVSLRFRETSGSTSYSNVQGSLTGIILNV